MDELPVITVTATDGLGTEAPDGNDFVFTFTRAGDLSGALTVNYNITQTPLNGAQPGFDFNGFFAGSVQFAAGSATAILNLEAFEDSIAEGPETFSVAIAPSMAFPQSYVVGAQSSATGTIEDNEEIPVVSITPLDAVKSEGSGFGFTTYTFEVSRTGSMDSYLQLNYAVTGATDGSDFSGQLPPFVIPPGQSSTIVTIQVEQDQAFEADESFTVTLLPPQPFMFGGIYTVSETSGSAIGTILNDDQEGLPFVLIDRSNIDSFGNESFDPGMSITLHRTGYLGSELTVSYTLESNLTPFMPALPRPASTGPRRASATRTGLAG